MSISITKLPLQHPACHKHEISTTNGYDYKLIAIAQLLISGSAKGIGMQISLNLNHPNCQKYQRYFHTPFNVKLSD